MQAKTLLLPLLITDRPSQSSFTFSSLPRSCIYNHISASRSTPPPIFLDPTPMASSGSNGGGSASGSTAAVCCMCGDHGLPHELFRCNLCRQRIQHRYCSDLYPRAAGPYRGCNWCLRERGGGGAGEAPTAAAPGTQRRSDGDGRDTEMGFCGCSTRSAFSADPGKPIKKLKIRGRERAVRQQPVATKRSREVVQQPAAAGGGKARFKVKVRRYKLLAEVIC